MNSKKLFLLSLLAFSVATVRPNASNELIPSTVDSTVTADDYMGTTVIPGVLVGGFTGTAIAYLSGTLFDALVQPKLINALICNPADVRIGLFGDIIISDKATTLQKCLPAIIALSRFGAQVGSKWYWEKPLRNKIMNWIQQDLIARGVKFNAELQKTLARTCAWIGTASQTESYYNW